MGRPPKKQKTEMSEDPEIRVKIRIGNDAIGPGKIALLEAVDVEHSISGAARSLGMSFRRAWHLLDTMNNALGRAVVETEVGGPGGGGARLSPFGAELIRRYRETMADVDARVEVFLNWLNVEK